MKKLLIVALAGISSFAFSELHTWDFNSGADSAISDTGLRLSGSVGSAVEGKWNDSIALGDTVSGGTSGLGSVYLSEVGSDYMGPIGGLTRATDQVELTIEFNQINMAATPTSNTDFAIALTDSENATGSNRHWLGLSVYDLFGNDRLVAAVKSSNVDLTIDTSDAGVPGFGHAPDSSANGRKSFDLITGNGELTTGPITLAFGIDFGAGTWVSQVNGTQQGFGTFDNTVYEGVDGIQTRMANFGSGDFVELESMTLNVIPEPATLGFLGVAGSGLLILRRRLSSISS